MNKKIAVFFFVILIMAVFAGCQYGVNDETKQDNSYLDATGEWDEIKVYNRTVTLDPHLDKPMVLSGEELQEVRMLIWNLKHKEMSEETYASLPISYGGHVAVEFASGNTIYSCSINGRGMVMVKSQNDILLETKYYKLDETVLGRIYEIVYGGSYDD